MTLVLVISSLLFLQAMSFSDFLEKGFNHRQNGSLQKYPVNVEATSMRTLDATDNNFNEDDFSDWSDQDESDLYVPIMALSYFGYWTVDQDNSSQEAFGFFTGSNGLAEFVAQKDPILNIDNNLVFHFYDGPYKDGNFVILNMIYDNMTDFDPLNSTFKNDNVTFFMFQYDTNGSKAQSICQGSYQLSFIDTITGLPYQKVSNDYESVYAQFWLTSPICGISMFSTISVDNSEQQSQIMYYSIAITLLCVVHLYACIALSKKILMNENEGKKISMLTVGFIIGWDVYLCLFHLYDSLTVDEYFHYFITPAFWYFILVSIFETRLILLVWKANYYANFQSITALRRGLTKFYIQLYGFLAVFLTLCYYFVPKPWFLSLAAFFFVPQIVDNAIRGQKYKFDFTYIFLLGVVRISLPLYVKGYSGNIFSFTPDTGFIYFYIGIISAQVFILFLQSRLGSRFLVPSCFLPPKYNYYVKINYDDAEHQEACPICMDIISQHPTHTKTKLLDQLIPSKQITIMRTPCRHEFHDDCLKEWMDLKLECPSCRSKLPAVC